MNISSLTKPLSQMVSANATSILTVSGVVGTVTTAVLAARGGMQTQQDLDDLDGGRIVDGVIDDTPLTRKEKIHATWPNFIPAIVSGTLTVGCIVFAQRINAQRAAGLAAAYAIAESRGADLKTKLEEKLTGPKAQTAKDEIMQDRLDKHPPAGTIILGGGPVLCYDSFSDRYFRASAESIRKAEKAIRSEIEIHGEANLRMLYDELDLPRTQYDDILGWNEQHPIKITIGAMMVNDNDACLCIEHDSLPLPNYGMREHFSID